MAKPLLPARPVTAVDVNPPHVSRWHIVMSVASDQGGKGSDQGVGGQPQLGELPSGGQSSTVQNLLNYLQ